MTTHFDDRGYYERVSGPVEALLSLQDVKRQVSVKHSDDDDILQRLIETATEFLDGPSGCLVRRWSRKSGAARGRGHLAAIKN